MVPASLGFAACIVLLAVKAISIVVELYRRQKQRNRRRLGTNLQFLAVIMSFFVAVFGVLTFSRMNDIRPDLVDQCQNADADIVGSGVRGAAWGHIAILLFIAATGSFHVYPTAVQEVGAGLLVSHIALATALLIPMARRSLSPTDSILGSMVLDVQNVALSVQLVAKQTLASRWQTITVILGQLAGMAAIGLLTAGFRANHLAAGECRCLSVFWWGWFSNCSGSTAPNEISTFWVYFALRLLAALHCSGNALRRTWDFDEAERREADNPCGLCGDCKRASRREAQPGDCCRCDPCGCCGGCRRCNAKLCVKCDTNNCQSCIKWRKRERCDNCPGRPLREGKGLIAGRSNRLLSCMPSARSCPSYSRPARECEHCGLGHQYSGRKKTICPRPRSLAILSTTSNQRTTLPQPPPLCRRTLDKSQ